MKTCFTMYNICYTMCNTSLEAQPIRHSGGMFHSVQHLLHNVQQDLEYQR